MIFRVYSPAVLATCARTRSPKTAGAQSLVLGGPLGGGRAGPRPPYPADVLAALPRGEGLRAHNHAAAHEGPLPSAQAAAVFGANRHPGITCHVRVCLFIHLERKSEICQERTGVDTCLLRSSKYGRKIWSHNRAAPSTGATWEREVSLRMGARGEGCPLS